MTEVTVYFHGEPGGLLDERVENLAITYGGHVAAAGNLLVGPHAGQRDVQVDVPPKLVDRFCQALREAGFTRIEVN